MIKTYPFVFILFICMAKLSHAQSGVQTLSFKEYIETMKSLDIKSPDCASVRLNSYAFPNSSTAYESTAGIIVSNATSTLYSLYGTMTTLMHRDITLGIDSTTQGLYLRKPSNDQQAQMDILTMNAEAIDPKGIGTILKTTGEGFLKFKIAYIKGSPIEYIEFEIRETSVKKMAIQYPWQDYEQYLLPKETYHPYLVIQFKALKNCKSYASLNELSTYLKLNENSVYVPSQKYSAYHITDLRYQQPNN